MDNINQQQQQQQQGTTTNTNNEEQHENELIRILQNLKENLEIKDRKWRTKTYKECFLHSHAVAHVMNISAVKSEEKAVQTLNELRSRGYIQHVVDPNKPFKVNQRSKLYFRFVEENVYPKFHHVVGQKQQQQQPSLQQQMNNQKLITPQMMNDMFMASEQYCLLTKKLSRLETSLNQISDVSYATDTKLEIVHQATISLIQTMVATAALLLIMILHTLYVIVPHLHHSRLINLLTSAVGTLLIGGFLKQGTNLWTVWLQLDTCVFQAVEGEDVIEDYEVDCAATSTAGSTTEEEDASTSTQSATPPIVRPPMMPKPPLPMQKRQSSLFLKEAVLRTTSSSTSSSGSAAVTTSSSRSSSEGATATKTKVIQQRQPKDLPHVSKWPHRPVMVCANTPTDPSLRVEPKYGNGPCPIGKSFEFSSDLFEGKILVRLKNVPNSDDPVGDETYFTGRRRLFQTLVQGRFKQSLRVDEVLTGHEFVKPLQNLPHPWILKAATNLIGKLAPGAQIQVSGNNPTMLASLAATSQIVRGDEPGNEPNIDTLTANDLEEDCSLLGGKFANGTISSTGRKLHLAAPSRACQYSFDTQTIYTFDFYQSILNCCDGYKLDLGLANIGMIPVLAGQPIQSLCKTTDGRYLWSFQIWHEHLLPSTSTTSEKEETKLKTT